MANNITPIPHIMMRPTHSLLMPKGFSMKLPTPVGQLGCLLVLLLVLSSCIPDKTVPAVDLAAPPPAPVQTIQPVVRAPLQLPVRYQRPSYMVDPGNKIDLEDVTDDVSIKVGASIRSTKKAQPLWDILKRLAALKRMSVSWASDVDQYVLVDVDINANDDFFTAIDNLLRQVDYYHEMKGSTIVVKYKETRQFHVAMPYTKQLYETATGGNVLGSNKSASNIEGTIRLDSKGNKFDIWENIRLNLDTIMEKWSYRRESATSKQDTPDTALANTGGGYGPQGSTSGTPDQQKSTTETGHLTKTAETGYYIIDRHLGLITVTAPRPIMEKVSNYIAALKKSIYKQVSIEAKIIEVQLRDSSSIGLDWNLLLRNLSLAVGTATFGTTREHTLNNNNTLSDTLSLSDDNNGVSTSTRARTFDYELADPLTADTGTSGFTGTITSAANTAASATTTAATIISSGLTSGISGAISLAAFSFDSFLNAVKQQGQTTILSNPRLSVLNGQPALITVGRNVTYIDSIDSDVNNDTGTVSYTVNTERVLSGVGLALTANILDDDMIILNLVPVTSELQEPIEYRTVGLGEVGLPIINVREMSTTVKVKDGEMLVIGGLISNSDENQGTFVPGTSSIPFLKYLFGYEKKTSTKRELIILLKPRII